MIISVDKGTVFTSKKGTGNAKWDRGTVNAKKEGVSP